MIVNCGVAGAYPGSGLSVGELAVASAEHDADTGVEPGDGGAVAPLSIALHDHEESLYGSYPVDPNLSKLLLDLAKTVAHAKRGPFVTSATVTSTATRAKTLEQCYSALCENMEGAALARVRRDSAGTRAMTRRCAMRRAAARV